MIDAPRDVAGLVPGQVRINTERLGDQSRSTSAVVLIPGGPGQAGAPFLSLIADAFAATLPRHDIVAYDPRGTGRSSMGAPCALRDRGLATLVASCERVLGAEGTTYTVTNAVNDLEAVRAELGVQRMVLYGVSYGTRIAMSYASAYPDYVQAVVLDSPVPAQPLDPFRQNTFAALPRILDEVCARICRVVGGSLTTRARALASKLRRAPLHGYQVSPQGRRTAATLDLGLLIQLITARDLNPTIEVELPGAVASALRNDPQPALRLAYRVFRAQPSALGANESANLAATCSDSELPWSSATTLVRDRQAAAAAAASRVSPSAIGGFPSAALVASPILALCYGWRSPPAVTPAPRFASRTLVLSGTTDSRTPTESARALSASITNATLATVPGAPHSVLTSDATGCARRVVTAFLKQRTVKACRRQIPRLEAFRQPPATLSSAELALLPVARRAATAVGLTLDDLARQLAFTNPERPASGRGPAALRVGGLRGGSARRIGPATVLNGYTGIAGVRLTARIDGRRPVSTLTVSGSPAISGKLRLLRNGRFTGHLGGRRVRGHADAYGSSPVRIVR